MWIGFCKQKSYNPRTGNDDDEVDDADEFVDDDNIGLTTSQYVFYQLILSLLFSTTIIFISIIGMESLIVTPISKAAANQRAGRAGNKNQLTFSYY